MLYQSVLRFCAVFITVFVFCFAFLSQAIAKDLVGPNKWSAWYDFGGYYNSDDASRGEVTFFLPITQSYNHLMFLEGRGKFFENDVQEGNFALGYRQMMKSGYNLGAWIGSDVRSTELNNTFFQLSGGFEALSHNFDARINWYGPVTSPKIAGDPSFTQVALQGTNIFMIGGEEVALYGVDGEIGARLPVEMMQLDPKAFELRVYAGAFHFDHEDALEEISGGKGRVELRLNDIVPSMPGSLLTAEYEFSYDDVREERHQVGLRLRLPFSNDASGKEIQLAKLNAQERRMIDRIERDTDIITTLSKAEKVEDAITNVDFDKVAYVNDGGDDIETTSSNQGDNTLIIVNGTVDNGQQNIQGNQTIMGGGSIIQVRGVRTGALANFNAPGSKPLVRNSGGGNVLRLVGDNIHIDGLTIDGNNNGGNGISVQNNRDNIAITQNMIINTNQDGIDFRSNHNRVRIFDNMIVSAGNEGIDFEDLNTDVIITGNIISTPDSDGIVVEDDNSNWLIANNTITDTGNEGIEFEDRNDNIIIRNNVVTGTNDEAVEFDNRNSNIIITNNTISSENDEAIEFGNRNTNIIVTNNRLDAPGDDIVELGNNNTGLISGNNLVISGNSHEGLEFGDGNTFSILGNIFGNIRDNAIEFDDENTMTISNNIFNGPTGAGDNILQVNGIGNQLSGDGNIANVPLTCGSGTFVGSMSFANSAVVFIDGVAPCN